jgi:hypothetical protein
MQYAPFLLRRNRGFCRSAGEPWLDIRKPHVVSPSVCHDRD